MKQKIFLDHIGIATANLDTSSPFWRLIGLQNDGEDEVVSTASEWVFTTQSGNLASVVDLSFGVGLEILE